MQFIDGKEHNIGFFSRALSSSEQKLHIYFREAIACLEGIGRARIYAMSSPFQLDVRTDQHSLQFTDKVDKGPLASYLLAKVADVDYRITWIQGSSNVIADFLSRYGTSGPRELTDGGLVSVTMELLRALGNQHRDSAKLWVYAHRETVHLQRQLQRWRRPRNKIQTGNIKESHIKQAWDFAVLVPKVLTAPQTVARLLQTGKPFAALIPLDLLAVVPMNEKDGSCMEPVYKALKSASKIVMPGANQCWVVAGCDCADAVCLTTRVRQATVAMSEVGLQQLREQRVVDLRRRLRERGASTSGTKSSLVSRLAAMLDAEGSNDSDDEDDPGSSDEEDDAGGAPAGGAQTVWVDDPDDARGVEIWLVFGVNH